MYKTEHKLDVNISTFFLLNFHCLTYSALPHFFRIHQCVEKMTFNKFQVWKDDSVTTRRFETSLKLFYPLSFIKWLKLTLFLSKIICLTCSMWHWKWKYIFTKIDTGYGLCDISYQDWQHCRLNICKKIYWLNWQILYMSIQRM